MSLSQNLLWLDGLGGAVVGLGMLALHGLLSPFYGLPADFLLFMGWVNLAYGCYSLSLARRTRRPRALILLLVAGNSIWALACLRWAVLFSESATIWGLAHLVAEGLYVGSLAGLEWRWREALQTGS